MEREVSQRNEGRRWQTGRSPLTLGAALLGGAFALLSALPVNAADAASTNGPRFGKVELEKRGDGAVVSSRVRWRRGAPRRHTRRFLRLTTINPRNGSARVLASRRVPAADVSRHGWTRARLRLDRRERRGLRFSSSVYLTATRQSRSPSGEVRRSLVAVHRPTAGGNGSHGCRETAVRKGADLRGCLLVGAVLKGADLRRAKLRGADLAGADLRGSDLTGANLRSADLTHTNLIGADGLDEARADPQPAGFTLPDDNGRSLETAIASARQSIDIVIYEFGGPNLVGQTGDPGWLIDAVERGVDVRLILNGEVFDDACTGVDASSQADCAWNFELDPYYATLAQLRAARQRALAAGGPAGKVSIQFANNDFNITHQKTILIDAVDGNGKPLSAAELAASPTAEAIVMTGNLQAYPSLWGQRTAYVDDTKTLINPDYETDPAASCAAGSGSSGSSSCEAEWEARDFGVILDGRHFADYVRRIESVFSSDLACGGPTPRTNTNGLLDTKLADTWANGSTYDFSSGTAYPDWTEGGYYPLDGVQPGLPDKSTIQGNSRKRQLRLINRAHESLRVYNEEMSDYNYDDPTDPTTIVGALARAGDRLGKGKVRVVMAGTVSPSNSYAEEFDTLVKHGVKIHLLDDSDPSVTYIHAKAIVADDTDAFVGSENFSGPSMDYNRELGLMLTNRSSHGRAAIGAPNVIAKIATAFRTDWRTEGGNWTEQGSDGSSVAAPERTPSSTTGSDTPTYPMACGAMPTRTAPPPSDEQGAG